MENDKLVEVPYGEAFFKCWNSYVQFMKDNNRDASIKAQNWVLKSYLEDKLTEEEAIKRIWSSKINVNKYLLFKSFK